MELHLHISPRANNKMVRLYIFQQCYLTLIRLFCMGQLPHVGCHRFLKQRARADFIYLIWYCPAVTAFLEEAIELLSRC
ncbi:hypothetical protein GDO78_012163 [Eleutherodactylus coqui]|uniref:Uncharacterized protein n=1 Tax=Eleutherodactylus coqui TaxID=57060 RepID=A0A8J6K640_ELECQ|nr:hypothetical protein GDO78_012163 [Eleutherodactylus coqui]